MFRLTRKRTVAIIFLITLLFAVIPYTSAAGELSVVETPLDGALLLRALAEEGVLDVRAELPRGFDYERMYNYLRMIYPECKGVSWRVYPAYTQLSMTVYTAPEESALPMHLAGENDWANVMAFAEYVMDVCQYDYMAEGNPETAGDGPFSARGVFMDGMAVCDGYSSAFAMLCNAAGIDCLYVSGGEMNHSWNCVILDGEMYFVDLTYQDTLPANSGKSFILLTEEELSETHTWDKEALREMAAVISPELSAAAEPTRKDAAEMLAQMMGPGALETAEPEGCPFTDIEDSAAIGMMYGMGYIEGMKPDLFMPESLLTPQDFSTMLLRIAGYSEDVDFSWATALEDALRLGVYSEGVYEQMADMPLSHRTMAVAAGYVLGMVD